MHELHFHPDDYTELEVDLNTRVRNNTPPLVVTNPARSVIKFKQQNVLVTFRKTWLETRRVHWESETFPELGCLTGFMPVESEYTSGEASSPSCCSKVSCSLLCLQRVPSVSNKFYICDASWIQRMRSCVCVCVCGPEIQLRFITDKPGPLNSTFMLNVTVYSASHAPNERMAWAVPMETARLISLT